MTDSPNRRLFLTTAGASLAGLIGASDLVAGAQPAPAAAPTTGASPDLMVINAKVYTIDPRMPRAEAFAVSGGRFVAVGSTSDIKNLAGKNTQTFDANGMTVVPGFIDCHNHAGGEVLLNEVLVGNPFEVEFVSIRSIIGKLRERAQADAAGHLGRRLLLRRYQAERQACAQHPRSGRSLDGSSGGRAPPRRPHLLLQQQGLRDGRHHQGHAEPDGRHLRQGRQRRAERPRHRSRVGAIQQDRRQAHLYAGAERRSARAKAWPTSRSSSPATA